MVPIHGRIWRAAVAAALVVATTSPAHAIECKSILAANNPPVAVDDAIQAATIDVPVAVLANDYDPDPGETSQLTITSFTQGAFGSVTLGQDGRSLVYHSNDTTKNDSFSYTIADPQHNASTAVVSVAASGSVAFTFTCTGQSCVFIADSSTVTSDLRDYTWDFGDGIAYTAPGVRASHVYTLPSGVSSKSYQVSMTANYWNGDHTKSGTSITISLSYQANWTNCCNDPNVAANNTGLKQTFSLTAAEASNFPMGTQFAWDFGEATPTVMPTGYYSQLYGFDLPGVKVVGLIATESNGTKHSSYKNIPIYNIPPGPDIQATVSANGKTFTFDPTHSTDEWQLDTWGANLQPNPYQWDFGDGTYDIRRAVPGSMPDKVSHTYKTPGSYIVKLTLTDNVGETRTFPRQFEVTNLPPVAQLDFNCHGLTCTFDASRSTDPDNDVTQYAWAFGDGTTATNASPVKTFAAAGCYQVDLTVRDNIGLPSTTVHRTVSVTGARTAAASPFIIDAHAVTGATLSTSSNLNGLLEPGETVLYEPTWTTATSQTPVYASITSTGSTALHRVDSNATYDVSQGVADCWATGDCYALQLDNVTPRPALHWDIAVNEQTPSGVKSSILHVGRSFIDVQPTDWYYPYAEAMLHNGVTAGCGNNSFCGANLMDRASMAVWLLTSKFGAGYQPPACTTDPFIDAPCSQWFGPWVADLKARAITTGCSANQYCPANNVTRAEMAVFILRTIGGPTYLPPHCSPDFTDVPCTNDPATSYWAADWISELKRRGITGGCSPTTFCPANTVSRAEMSVFMTVAFNLQAARPQCPAGTPVQ